MQIPIIINHLQIPNAEEKLDYVMENLFAPSFTFRKGVIGEWKEEFTAEQKRCSKRPPAIC